MTFYISYSFIAVTKHLAEATKGARVSYSSQSASTVHHVSEAATYRPWDSWPRCTCSQRAVGDESALCPEPQAKCAAHRSAFLLQLAFLETFS